MVRASASGAVDLGFDSELGQTNDFKIGMHAFLLASQHRNIVENKPASLLVVPFGKALSEIPLFWCDRQMADNS